MYKLVSVLSSYISKSGTTIFYGNSMFIFLKDCQTFSPKWLHHIRSHQQCKRIPVLPSSHQHLLFLPFGIITILMDMKCYLVVLICISLMISNVEHFSHVHWPFVFLLWRNVYSYPLPTYKLGHLSFSFFVVLFAYSIYWTFIRYTI